MNKNASFWLTAAALSLLAACSSTPSENGFSGSASGKRALPFGEYADEKGCTVADKYTGETEGVVNRLTFEHFNGVHGMKKDDVFRHLKEAKARGCSLESRDLSGFAPVHTAILLLDTKMLDFLLKNGASPYTTIQGDSRKQAGKQFYGQNSYELVASLKGFELKDNKMKTIKARNGKKLRVPKNKGVRTDYSQVEALLNAYR
ncbi:MAG: hypothetical protein Q4D82_04170 [Neisseria sp.]|nr:hypothetical protein [Neisseria sp.]